MLLNERNDILKSMENHNLELANAFKKYRQIGSNDKLVEDEDGISTTMKQSYLIQIYNDHKELLENILKCSGYLKNDINKLEKYFECRKGHIKKIMINFNYRPNEYSEENIRDVFYKLLNPFALSGCLTGGGNSLEKNDRVTNFKIHNGIIYGDTLDNDNIIYYSSIDMGLVKYKKKIIEKLHSNSVNLEKLISIINQINIQIIPGDFYKLKCKCSCRIAEQPCKYNIALYFKFIDNIKINKSITIELFNINIKNS